MNSEKFTKILQNEGLAPNSIKKYVQSMNKLSKNVFNCKLDDLTLQQAHTHKKVLKYIYREDVSPNKKRDLATAYLKYTRSIPNFSSKIMKCIEEEKKAIYMFCNASNIYQKPTKKEIENMMPMEEIVRKRNELKGKITKEYDKYYDIRYLILCLYTYLPPLRSQDFIGTKVYKKVKNPIDHENYVDISKKILVVHNHKTMKSKGTRLVPLPDELIKIIKKFQKKAPSPYLLPQATDLQKPMKTVALTNTLARIIGKKVGCQMLRKMFVSELIAKKPTKNERKKVADIMGHSLSTQRTTYDRFNDEIFFEDPDSDEK